ncbi:hypothetical protein, partial [Paenibacillus albilobatus]|uniref:hypothetical protein n=1 Tax=Paenibacillus albilobatus TaxID=2716884 RepID=UPI001BB32408
GTRGTPPPSPPNRIFDDFSKPKLLEITARKYQTLEKTCSFKIVQMFDHLKTRYETFCVLIFSVAFPGFFSRAPEKYSE